MTFEEWAAMVEEEPGELVHGRLEQEEVQDLIHELVVSWLIHGRYGVSASGEQAAAGSRDCAGTS